MSCLSRNLDKFSSEWPDYTTSGEQHIVFQQDGDVGARYGYRTKECSFWKYLMPEIRDKLTSNNSCNATVNENKYLLVNNEHISTNDPV